MAEEIDLPVIDFSSPDRLKKAQEIVRAMETVGFLFLDKVPGHDERVLRKWVDWFWSLSKEKKMKIARKRYNPTNKHVRNERSMIDVAPCICARIVHAICMCLACMMM
jgi:isopenicillin N synthase-like dioxygenase